MFKDKNEELRRLEALLQEEEEDERLLAEEAPEEEPFFQVPEEEEDDAVEQFYANYANSYQAYNADTTDTDLDTFSEEVWQARSSRGFSLVALACVLATAVLLVVLYLVVRYGGWL